MMFRNIANIYFNRLVAERKKKKEDVHKQKSWFGRMFSTNIPIEDVKLSYGDLSELHNTLGKSTEVQKAPLDVSFLFNYIKLMNYYYYCYYY